MRLLAQSRSIVLISEFNAGSAGLCSEWELALYALFDGELLDKADGAMPRLPSCGEKIEIRVEPPELA
jgi:hypothetical protein